MVLILYWSSSNSRMFNTYPIRKQANFLLKIQTSQIFLLNFSYFAESTCKKKIIIIIIKNKQNSFLSSKNIYSVPTQLLFNNLI